MKRTVIIGTRGSQLALWQAEDVKNRLNACSPDLKIRLEIIRTTGDRIRDVALTSLSKGAFTREIELALLDGAIDLAVHSVKDLPTDLPDGLCIAAVPTREDPRDVLVSQLGQTLEKLPEGAKIGTASPRRRSQLLYLRPDLQVVDLRGNLDTRLRKLHDEGLDGVILAAAGIKRLIGEDIITAHFEVDHMVPAAGQGALGIETRKHNDEIRDLLYAINDRDSEIEVVAERSVLRALGGGCQVPIGANASLSNGLVSLIAVVCSPDGKHRICAKKSGKSEDIIGLGEALVQTLRAEGAADILNAGCE